MVESSFEGDEEGKRKIV